MLHHLQRKFKRDPTYFQVYASFVTEYHDIRHMTRIPDNEPDPPRAFYLPHHGVIRESTSTTKLRVVFNGSFLVANGLPLNEILHTGPKLRHRKDVSTDSS